MKAVVVHGKNDLRIDDIPEPTVGDDDVLVAMEWGGICGSDIAYWKNAASGTAILREPLVLGHEVAGHVARVGANVKNIAEGTRVAIHPSTYQGNYTMPTDMKDRINLWPEVRYFGSAAFMPHEQGGFSAFRTVRPDQLRTIPDNVSTKDAALAEPFGVAIHAVHRAGELTDKRVLVNGAGPIGALTVAAAKAAGAAEIIASDLSKKALEIAAAMGATAVVNPANGDPLPSDVEVAIEASGAAGAIGNVIAAVRRGGILVQVANLPAGNISVALGNIVTREIEYRGSYRFIDEITDALTLMSNGVDVSPLETHEFVLEEAEKAFATAADRSTGSSKVMLELS